jgi:hypothetical protein
MTKEAVLVLVIAALAAGSVLAEEEKTKDAPLDSPTPDS